MGKINNKITTFLLDTGASVTAVDRQAIKYGNLKDKNEFCLEITFSELKMLGTTTVQIETGKIPMNHKVIVKR